MSADSDRLASALASVIASSTASVHMLIVARCTKWLLPNLTALP